MCPHVQIAFLKFTSCDNQALVRCIPIAAVAVHLNILNFQESTTILDACTKKSGNLLNAPRIHMVRESWVNPRSRHPKDLKTVPDTSLHNTQQYKVRINGKVEQS